MTPATDWDRYRACRVCGAALGEQCASMTGNTLVRAEKPHRGRKLRTGYARAGGDR